MSRPPRAAPALVGALFLCLGSTLARAEVTVYLDTAGTTVKPGADDPSKRYSSLVTDAVDVPAWSIAAADLQALTTCLATEFAPFAVRFTTTRPSGAQYYEVIIGGGPALVGAPAGALAAAPASCQAQPRSVVFAFADAAGGDPARICQAVGLAIGLANGLDASTDARDLMSATPSAGKSFVDETLPCGASQAAPCRCGGEAQNSYQTLAAALGLRGEGGDGGDGSADDPGDGSGDDESHDPTSVGLVGGCNVGGSGAAVRDLAGLLAVALLILRRRP